MHSDGIPHQVIEETASNAFKYREPHTKVRPQMAPELAPPPPRRMQALNTAPRARPSSSPTHASAHRGAHMLTTAPPALPKIRVNISIETATEATIEAAAVTAAEASAESLAHRARAAAVVQDFRGADRDGHTLHNGEKSSTGCLGFIPKGAVPGDQFLHIAICNQNRAGVAPLTPTQVRDWSVIASD